MPTLLKPDFVPDRRRIMFGDNIREKCEVDYWTALKVLSKSEPWYWHCLKAVLLLDEAYNHYLQKVRPYPYKRQMKRRNNEVARQFHDFFNKTQWYCGTDFDTVMDLMDDMQDFMRTAFVVHRNSVWTSFRCIEHDGEARNLCADIAFVNHLCMVCQTFITGVAGLKAVPEIERIMYLLKEMGANILTAYIDPEATVSERDSETMVLSIRKITKQYEEWDGFDYDDAKDSWVAGDIGTIVECGDYYFDMLDIITDLKQDTCKGEIFRWYDYTLRCSYLGITDCNYRSWLKGCPRHSEEDFGRLEDAKKRVEQAESTFRQLVTEYKNKVKI